MKKDKIIVIRVTAAKKASLEASAKAAGLSLSEWLTGKDERVEIVATPKVRRIKTTDQPKNTWRNIAPVGALLKK